MEILSGILELMLSPNFDFVSNQEAANLLGDNISEFNRVAWTLNLEAAVPSDVKAKLATD